MLIAYCTVVAIENLVLTLAKDPDPGGGGPGDGGGLGGAGWCLEEVVHVKGGGGGVQCGWLWVVFGELVWPELH